MPKLRRRHCVELAFLIMTPWIVSCDKSKPTKTEATPTVTPSASAAASATPAPSPVASSAPKAPPTPSSKVPSCQEIDEDCGAIAAIVESAADHFASLQCVCASGATVTRVTVPTVGSCRDASTKEEWVIECTRDLKKELAAGEILALHGTLTPCFKKAGWPEWHDKATKTSCTLDNAWVVRIDREPILELKCVQAKEKDAGVADAAPLAASASASAAASAQPAPSTGPSASASAPPGHSGG